MSVGVRELRQRLSRYLAQVRRGETVVVTDRGRPIARLEPIGPAAPPDQVRDLVTAGLLVYKGHPRRLPTPIRMLPGDKTSTDFVAEQRR